MLIMSQYKNDVSLITTFHLVNFDKSLSLTLFIQ